MHGNTRIVLLQGYRRGFRQLPDVGRVGSWR